MTRVLTCPTCDPSYDIGPHEKQTKTNYEVYFPINLMLKDGIEREKKRIWKKKKNLSQLS